MPITKQAIKRVRQTKVRAERNKHYKNRMKSMIKLLFDHIDKGDMEKAVKLLPEVVSAIDTAAKKRLIHGKNAAHKKSRLQRAVSGKAKAGSQKKESEPAVPKKKAEKEVGSNI